MYTRQSLYCPLKKEGIEVLGMTPSHFSPYVSPEALRFLARIHRAFNPRRLELLEERKVVEKEIREGKMPTFLEETKHVREGDWKVSEVSGRLLERKVDVVCLDVTSPKMLYNALHSKASGVQVDFDDGYAPTWRNTLLALKLLFHATRGSLMRRHRNGNAASSLSPVTSYSLQFIRPRSLNLPEAHVLVDGVEVSGAFFDFAIHMFNNGAILYHMGVGPYFYLPKLESYKEAALWKDVFEYTEKTLLKVEKGIIKAIVLIENILAAFQMEEILYELRFHMAGLNAGKWDYIFSFIKKFHHNPKFVLPERSQLSNQSTFLSSYMKLLCQTAHKRGTFAIGGMAPTLPVTSKRRDAEQLRAHNDELYKRVRDMKKAEASLGFDGSLCASPVFANAIREAFDSVIGGEKPNQLENLLPSVSIKDSDLLEVPTGKITSKGLEEAVVVCILYIDCWLVGKGSVAVNGSIEDLATCEICRSLLWQWIRYGAKIEDAGGEQETITLSLVNNKAKEVMRRHAFQYPEIPLVMKIFHRLISAEEFVDFIPTILYPHIVRVKSNL